MATSPTVTRAAVNPLLRIIKDTLIASLVSDGPDFNLRQLSVFLKVYLEPGTEHTVSSLAAALNVAKPTITRALDRLEEFNFTKRETDRSDRRSAIIRRTPKGSAYLGTFNGYLNTASKAKKSAP